MKTDTGGQGVRKERLVVKQSHWDEEECVEVWLFCWRRRII